MTGAATTDDCTAMTLALHVSDLEVGVVHSATQLLVVFEVLQTDLVDLDGVLEVAWGQSGRDRDLQCV